MAGFNNKPTSYTSKDVGSVQRDTNQDLSSTYSRRPDHSGGNIRASHIMRAGQSLQAVAFPQSGDQPVSGAFTAGQNRSTQMTSQENFTQQLPGTFPSRQRPFDNVHLSGKPDNQKPFRPMIFGFRQSAPSVGYPIYPETVVVQPQRFAPAQSLESAYTRSFIKAPKPSIANHLQQNPLLPGNRMNDHRQQHCLLSFSPMVYNAKQGTSLVPPDNLGSSYWHFSQGVETAPNRPLQCWFSNENKDTVQQPVVLYSGLSQPMPLHPAHQTAKELQSFFCIQHPEHCQSLCYRPRRCQRPLSYNPNPNQQQPLSYNRNRNQSQQPLSHHSNPHQCQQPLSYNPHPEQGQQQLSYNPVPIHYQQRLPYNQNRNRHQPLSHNPNPLHYQQLMSYNRDRNRSQQPVFCNPDLHLCQQLLSSNPNLRHFCKQLLFNDPDLLHVYQQLLTYKPGPEQSQRPSSYNSNPNQCQQPASYNSSSGEKLLVSTPAIQLTLDMFPRLVILKVLSFLSISDLVRVRLTCKHLNELSYDPDLWRSVNVCQVDRYARKQTFIAELLEQDCYIAGRQPPCTELEEVSDEDSNQTSGDEEHAEQQRGKLAAKYSNKTGENDDARNSSQTKSSWMTTGIAAFGLQNNKEKMESSSLLSTEGEQNKAKKICTKTDQKKKRVKDYIQKLTVNNASQIAPVYNISYTKYEETFLIAVDNACCLPSDIGVCPCLKKLEVLYVNFEPTILTMVSRHPWLSELSVTLIDPKSPPFSRLHEDTLTDCFNHFQTLSHLKKFQFVFPTSRLFRNSFMGNTLFFHVGKVYEAMSKFFEVVTSLEDIVITGVSDNVMKTIIASCRNLKCLAISSHLLTRNAFSCKAPVSSLQSLTIGTTLSSLDAELGSEIVKAFPNLRTINFTAMHASSQGLRLLLEQCRKLENVHLYKHPRQTLPKSDHTFICTRSTLSRFCEANRNVLKELSVCADVDDTFMRIFSTCNPALTSLTLIDCPRITEASLVAIAAWCPHLTYFKLRQEHSRVSAGHVLGFIRNSHSLTTVCVSSWNNKGRFVPLAEGSVLRGLHNTAERSDSSKAFSSSSDKIAVNFGQRQIKLDNNPISHKASDSLSQTRNETDCHTEMVQNGAQQWHTEGLSTLTRSQVREFSFGKVPQVTAEDMRVLVRVCPDLVELDLCGCLALGDSAVEVILRGCPRLRSLSLDRKARRVTSRPCHVTDTTLRHLVDHGTSLQHFRACHCFRFSPLGLARLIVHSVSLRTVDVTFGRYHELTSFDEVDDYVRQVSAKSSPPVNVVMGARDAAFDRKRRNCIRVTIMEKTVQV